MSDETDPIYRLIAGTIPGIHPVEAFLLYLGLRAYDRIPPAPEGGKPTTITGTELSRLRGVLTEGPAPLASLASRVGDEDLGRFVLRERLVPALSIQEIFERFPLLQQLDPFFRIIPIEVLRLVIALLDVAPGASLFTPLPGNFFEPCMLARLSPASVWTGPADHPEIPELISAIDGMTMGTVRAPGPASFDCSYVNLVNDASLSGGLTGSEGGLSILDILLRATRHTIVCFVPHAFLFRTVGNDKKLKQGLLAARRIAGVISLPKNILPYTIVPVDLIILDATGTSETVFMIDASSSFRRVGRKNIMGDTGRIAGTFLQQTEQEGFSTVVPVADIERRHTNLLPSLYLPTAEGRIIASRLERYEIRPLKGIVDIIRTTSVEGSETLHPIPFPPQEIYREVRVVDIPEYGFISSNSGPRRTRDLEGLIRNLLQPRDILISVKGNVGWIGIVPDRVRGHLIANQVFLILRMKEGIDYDPVLLLMYLKSDAAQNLLHRVVAGSMVSTLQAKDIENIPVPLFPDENRREILEKFREEVMLYEKMDSIRKQIDAIRASII